MRKAVTALMAGMLILPSAQARADDSAADSGIHVWLTPGFFSYHFERNLDLREDNFGLGAEIAKGDDWRLTFGSFINSERERSHYGGVQWRPLHWQFTGAGLHAGVVVAAIDGYPRMKDGGWFAFAMPLVAIETDRLGVNLSAVPTISGRLHGAVIAQFKLRVW
jgi:hypothetical protein